MEMGNELMKTYNQDTLDQAYNLFLQNHPEIVTNGLEPVGKNGRKGWNEKYMANVMDKEFLKSLGHKGDSYDFEESNPGTRILYSRLRALDNWENKEDRYGAKSL